jgi:indole-3-glycerol phosphate synthase
VNVLSEIIGRKRERVAVAKERVPLEGVRRRENPHPLRAALRAEGINVIAEFKRRSPSKGVIRADANLKQIVRSYEAGGAVGI